MTAPAATAGIRAPSLETIGMSKSFGALRALQDVSINVPAGSFHALLGENGAGKSTLVKCIMGFYIPDKGELKLDGKEVAVRNPKDAQALGVGMVYQHFTLVPALTAAENLVVSRADAPAFIDWRKERKGLESFLDRMPFRVPLDKPVSGMAAGEKQKLEILKLLYLDQRFLILDEPTSVLTPGEADEILGLLRDMAHRGEITVAMISHKFREVEAFCDDFTVLRRGARVGGGKVGAVSTREMAAMMIGDAVVRPPRRAQSRRRMERRSRSPVSSPKTTKDGTPSPGSTSRSRRAKSSVSPEFRATARASWSRLCPGSGRSNSARSWFMTRTSSRSGTISTSSRFSGCRRSR